MFIAEPTGERTLEIGQHLAKLWSGVDYPFLTRRVVNYFCMVANCS